MKDDFENNMPENIYFLSDVLNAKVLDMEDTDVEVVYDIKMVMNNKNKLNVTDVDPSTYARLRRTCFNFIASIFHERVEVLLSINEVASLQRFLKRSTNEKEKYEALLNRASADKNA